MAVRKRTGKRCTLITRCGSRSRREACGEMGLPHGEVVGSRGACVSVLRGSKSGESVKCGDPRGERACPSLGAGVESEGITMRTASESADASRVWLHVDLVTETVVPRSRFGNARVRGRNCKSSSASLHSISLVIHAVALGPRAALVQLLITGCQRGPLLCPAYI